MSPGERQYCTCHGTQHALLLGAAGGALICENCGNIPCRAQGPGDCLYCGAPYDAAARRIAPTASAVNTGRFTPVAAGNPAIAAAGAQQPLRPQAGATERQEAAAREFRDMVIRNVDEYAGADPDRAVIDDQMAYVPFDDS